MQLPYSAVASDNEILSSLQNRFLFCSCEQTVASICILLYFVCIKCMREVKGERERENDGNCSKETRKLKFHKICGYIKCV